MKKFLKKEIMYFSLSTLLLITSCKKNQQEDPADSNNLSAVTNNQSNKNSMSLSKTGQSNLFAYMNTLQYDKAMDTLKHYMVAKGFKTEISGNIPSKTALKANATSTSPDPDNATAQEWLTFYPVGATTEIDGNDPAYNFASPGGIIEKSADWVALQHHLNWWTVVSTEVIIIRLDPGIAAGSYSPHIIGLTHAGSRVVTIYRLNPVDWTENLNEHFPSVFGNAETQVIAHVAGTLSKFGFSTNGEGLHTFHVSEFIR